MNRWNLDKRSISYVQEGYFRKLKIAKYINIKTERKMNILEGNVKVSITHTTYKLYEDKYVVDHDRIPSIHNKLPPYYIEINIKDLPKRSAVKINKVCDICGKIEIRAYYKIMISRETRGEEKDYCQSCFKKGQWNKKYKKIPEGRSLLDYANNNKMTYLVEEYSSENSLPANEIYRSSSKKVKWVCRLCSEPFITSPNKRTRVRAQNCPYCFGKKINNNNCLWTTRPDIAALLENPEDGYKISKYSNLYKNFKCPRCGYVESKLVGNISKPYRAYPCLRCGDKVSYPEKFVTNILDQLKFKYIKNKVFHWSESKQYDFYVPSLQLIIETHGIQHYKDIFDRIGGRNSIQEKQNDDYKKYIALRNNIEQYVTLDCRSSDPEHIRNSIKISNFSSIFNLSNINWEAAHLFAISSSSIEAVANLYNEGKSLEEISSQLGITNGLVIKRLKKSNELGWTNFDIKKKYILKRN